ncbi:MAG: nuclear transport factor 2 family protein [Lachnospiraceae bacterium]|nr:nuclear transport factor 2 family protein [Lachnospiraceae bacterium]
MNDKEKIENCYRQMYHGMTTKDRTALLDVLDESFVLVHMTGMRQSREEFIRAVENGTLNYYSAKHQQMEVGIQGEHADMIGRSLVSAAVFGGGRHTWRLQQKLQLIKKADEWKITESRASTY